MKIYKVKVERIIRRNSKVIIIVGDFFNIFLLGIDRKSRLKNFEIKDLNKAINKFDLLNLYGII